MKHTNKGKDLEHHGYYQIVALDDETESGRNTEVSSEVDQLVSEVRIDYERAHLLFQTEASGCLL